MYKHISNNVDDKIRKLKEKIEEQQNEIDEKNKKIAIMKNGKEFFKVTLKEKDDIIKSTKIVNENLKKEKISIIGISTQKDKVIGEKQKVILEKVQQIGELKEEIDSINVTLQRKENELKSKTGNFSNIINSLEIKLNSKENEIEMKNKDLNSLKLRSQMSNVTILKKIIIY